MKVGIIGQGFVGSAIREGLKGFYEVLTYDTDASKCNSSHKEVCTECEIIFVCVPTPQQDTHMDVDVSIARDVLTQLSNLDYKGIVVIKSTITPDHLTTFKKK